MMHHNTALGPGLRFFGGLALALACLLAEGAVVAADYAMGLAALEEGDDRQRPALALQAGLGEFYSVNGYYWGRDFGPFRERSYLLGGLRKFSIFPKVGISGAFGVGLLYETLELNFGDAPQDNDEEANFNLGGAIRFGWEHDFGPTFLLVHWDSYVFPAGLNGGLFLSTGRKQLLKAGIGFRI